MSSHEVPSHHEIMTDEAQQEPIVYELTKEQRAALSDDVKVALAMESEIMRQPFPPKEFLKTLSVVTGLGESVVRNSIVVLREKEGVGVRLIKTERGSRLALEDEGREWLAEEIEKVKSEAIEASAEETETTV